MRGVGRWLLIGAALVGCQEVEETVDGGLVRLPPPIDGGGGGDLDAAPRPDAAILPDMGPDAEPIRDAAPPRDARPALDGAPPDAAPPPPDASPLSDATLEPGPLATECPIAWTALGADRPDTCAGRHHMVVAGSIEPPSVDIARSGQGRVLIGWTEQTLFDAGYYVLRQIDERRLVVIDEAQIEPFFEVGELVGSAAALAVQRETFHLALWFTSDSGSQVQYTQWRPDDSLAPVEVVSGLVGSAGEVDLAVADNGDVHVAWHDAQSGQILVRARRAPDAAWDADPFEVDVDLGTNADLGAAVRVVSTDARVQHVAYQHVLGRFGAAPAYRARIGDRWTARRTLDNNGNRRHSGVGLALAVHGDNRTIAYVDWVGGTGELRLARFGSADELPTFETLEAGLAIDETPSRFPLAMRVDRVGLLHLVAVVPDGGGRWALRYWRQTRLGGPLTWLVDTVDDDVEMRNLTARVDLFVDDDRRPHIAWFDAGDGNVHYAQLDPDGR